MKTTERPTSGIKFAEAAVLFVLILGLTVFVGIRLADQNGATTPLVTGEPDVTMTIPAESAAISHQPSQAPVDTAVAAAAQTAPDEKTQLVVPELVDPQPVSYAEAEEAYTRGDFSQAVDLFTDYTLQHPANAWGEYMLGMSLWRDDDPHGAVESFQAALLINPDHLKSLINQGRVLLEVGRPDEATQVLTTALTLDPQNVDARRVLARAQNNSGHFDQAEATYRQVLAAHRDDVWSLNNLGLLLIQQARFQEALPVLAHAVEIKADLPAVQNNLATALERLGYMADAKETYARALALDPAYDKAAASLARLAEVFEAPGLAPFDLAATAAGFDPLGIMGTDGQGLLVTATTTPTAPVAKPEQTTAKNR